ncbi:MAG: hypothetical protein ACE5SW_03435 [Nitrososphaeraceae archaeon]
MLSSILFFNTVYAQSSSSSITGDIERQIQNLIGNSMNKMIEDTINQVQQGINGSSQDLESLTKNSPNSKTFSGLGESIGSSNLENLYPYSSQEKEPNISLFTNNSKFTDNSDLEKKLKGNDTGTVVLEPSIIGMDTISSKSSNLKDIFPSLFN